MDLLCPQSPGPTLALPCPRGVLRPPEVPRSFKFKIPERLRCSQIFQTFNSVMGEREGNHPFKTHLPRPIKTHFLI